MDSSEQDYYIDPRAEEEEYLREILEEQKKPDYWQDQDHISQNHYQPIQEFINNWTRSGEELIDSFSKKKSPNLLKAKPGKRFTNQSTINKAIEDFYRGGCNFYTLAQFTYERFGYEVPPSTWYGWVKAKKEGKLVVKP